MNSKRTSLSITLAVWKGLLLRESLQRLFGGRVAWLWLVLEPAVHVVFLMFIFTAVRVRVVGGMETAVWLMVGMLAFFVFRRTGTQAMNAISANEALFTYRQVKPVDTVLVRAGLEGFLLTLIAFVLFFVSALYGLNVFASDPALVLESFTGIWLLGLGFGLNASVASVLVPELGKIIGLLMTPMYLFSGVIFPINMVPLPYREWLMVNPVAQGIEGARSGFSSYYESVPELSVGYLYAFAIVSIFVGLALHVRYALKLVTK